MNAWDLLVDRSDLSRAELLEREVPEAGDGEVVLRADRVGMTANNVTYALVGDSMRYWDFFPAEAGWGRVPLWGFADVVSSGVEEVSPGTRFYGFLPTSSHLVVRPDGAGPHGFRVASPNRAHLPAAYNVYPTTSGDPAYDADREDLQVLYRPLFITSFMLDDFLAEAVYPEADTLLVSSASSKTAYGTAFCARRHPERPRIVGLTSKRNVDFTASLGCYDDVVPYEDVEAVDASAVIYADMAGSEELRVRIHERFGDGLRYDAVVGATHMEATFGSGRPFPGAKPKFFFAPDRIKQRRADWGPRGVETRFGEAWKEFVPVVEDWVDVTELRGPEALRDAWLDTFAARIDPRQGLVVAV